MMIKFLIASVLAVANGEYITPNYQANAIVPTHGSSPASGSSFVTQAVYHSGAGASYVSPVYPKPELQPQHVPVIKNGVPVDTPEVQQARAEHFALYAKAAAAAEAAKVSAIQRQQAGHYDDGSYQQYQQPQGSYYPATANQYPSGALGSSYIYQSGGHLSNSGVYAHQGAPVDTAEVQQAKAAHFTAVQRAATRAATAEHHRYRRSALGLIHVPVITKDGVPVETPEVQAAKAQHLLAHANARAGHQEWSQATGGDYGSGANIWINYGTPEGSKVQYSISHNSYGGWKPYTGPQHYPVIDKDGNPVETPEVQIAKQQHFLAHAQAKLGLYGQVQTGSYYGASYPHVNLTPDGVPEETPEVQIAKAKHFAAHAEEQARHAKWAGQSDYYQIGSYH